MTTMGSSSSFTRSPFATPRLLRVLLLSSVLLWLLVSVGAWTRTTTERATVYRTRPSSSLAFRETRRRRFSIATTTSLLSASISSSSSSQDVPPTQPQASQQQQRRKRPSPQVTVVTTASAFDNEQSHAAAVAAAAAEVDWDWEPIAASAFSNGETKPVLLFDGVCNFCNDAVNTCLDLDPTATLRFASLHSQVGQALLIRSGKSPFHHDSIVLVTPNTAYFHSDAVLRVVQRLQGLPPPLRMSANVIRLTVPTWLRDATLKFVGERRHLFGAADADGPTCRLDLDGEYEGRFLD